MRLLSLFLGASQAASCPSYCNTCNEQHADCSDNGLTEIDGNDFEGFTSIDLSGNQFESVPRQLRQISDLENLNLSGNPIKNVDAFEFTNQFYAHLKSVQFNDCDSLDYIADGAFYSLDNLESVSFHNSALFFVSGQAFYECENLKSIDMSDTDLTYIDESLDLYLGTANVEAVNLDETMIECDCTNEWMASTSYIQGLNCGVWMEEEKCSPKVIRGDYTFDFARDSSAKAMCFIAGANELTTGRKRGRHSIHYHSVDQNDEGDYTCTGIGQDKSEVSVTYKIQTHDSTENDVVSVDESFDESDVENERDYSESSESTESVESESSESESADSASSSELTGALDNALDAIDDAIDEALDAVDDLVIGNVTDDSDSEGSSFSGDYEESSGSESEEDDINIGGFIGDDAVFHPLNLVLFLTCLFAL